MVNFLAFGFWQFFVVNFLAFGVFFVVFWFEFFFTISIVHNSSNKNGYSKQISCGSAPVSCTGTVVWSTLLAVCIKV